MSVTTIETVHAREVFDSRGRPTVEVEIACAGSRAGRAIVPSGASTGQFEALELRDGDTQRLDGLGVHRAVENVNTLIARALTGMDACDQDRIDQRLLELDGTPTKSRLGANAVLGASLATAYAAAEARRIAVVDQFHDVWQRHPSMLKDEPPAAARMLGHAMLLPLPMVNMISGGLHAGGNLDLQDFLILPVGAPDYRTAFDWIVQVYRRLGTLLSQAGHEGVLVGDEGGYGPKLNANEQALEFVVRAIEAAGLQPGHDVAIGLDVASTHFFEAGRYRLRTGAEEARLSADEMIAVLADWVARYPIISIEDGLAEDDWSGWRLLTERLSARVQLIGDDLFVTSRDRLRQGIDQRVANSVLIKLNQIGTLTETLQTLRLALDHGYRPVISARSGETEDATIADLVVATGAGQLKVGSVARSERLAKYNQLLRLAERSDIGFASGGRIFESLRPGA